MRNTIVDIRRLRIVGTQIDQQIATCKSCFKSCPLFDDGCGWEYTSKCKLTGQSGADVHAAYLEDRLFILSECPLPKIQSKKVRK
jgi:hypothetical protein